MKIAAHLVMGLAGVHLADVEAAFIEHHHPAGIILFSRNIENPQQVLKLVQQIRAAVKLASPPTIWIDQEGGRVQRLRDPFIRYPSPWQFSQLPAEKGVFLSGLGGELLGMELAALGIGVDCAPVLDIQELGADPVIGARAFGADPATVISLAGAWLAGLASSGVMGVGKHFPGHGAASADSHKSLPIIEKSAEELAAWELKPFLALLPKLPALMTAHLIAAGLDPEQPATQSKLILDGVLRKQWGYQGLIVSDALEMGALSGSLADRARLAVGAGCDLVLCCTGLLPDSQEVLQGIEDAVSSFGEQMSASRARISKELQPYRIEPQGLDSLEGNKKYRDGRLLLEWLAEKKFSIDPTEQ